MEKKCQEYGSTQTQETLPFEVWSVQPYETKGERNQEKKGGHFQTLRKKKITLCYE